MGSPIEPRIRNGVNIDKLRATIDAIGEMPVLGTFVWRADNRWIDGAHSRSTIRLFYGAGQEDHSRGRAFGIDAGLPSVLLGEDDGPSPVEYLLHGLAACLTNAVVYVAAIRGVSLESVESHLDGVIDLRGTLGLVDEVRNGFERIQMRVTVKGDASDEELAAIVERATQRSSVFDSITRGVPVSVQVINEGSLNGQCC